jgi:pimeloyl-ACP methyl ester carboxylesterase
MVSQTSYNINQTPARRTARVIHYNLSYIVQGEEHGPDGAIVLLHDIPAGAFTWEGLMPQLAGLGRSIYAVDMLGFGQSDFPWPADTSVWGQADALTFLLKQLKLTNVVLVGHGLGGAVAQILATRLYREQTAALVLVDTLCYLHAFAPNWPLTDMAKRQDVDAPKQISLEDLVKDLRSTLPQAVQNTKGFAKVIDNYVSPWNSELGKEVLFRHISLLIPTYINSVSSDLKDLGKPVLIIWGEKDEQTPIRYGQRLQQEIPGSLLATIPNAGHLVLFDAPDAVSQALGDFIQRL